MNALWFVVRGSCLFCWYWWYFWPWLFTFSYHNYFISYLVSYPLYVDKNWHMYKCISHIRDILSCLQEAQTQKLKKKHYSNTQKDKILTWIFYDNVKCKTSVTVSTITYWYIITTRFPSLPFLFYNASTNTYPSIGWLFCIRNLETTKSIKGIYLTDRFYLKHVTTCLTWNIHWRIAWTSG